MYSINHHLPKGTTLPQLVPICPTKEMVAGMSSTVVSMKWGWEFVPWTCF